MKINKVNEMKPIHAFVFEFDLEDKTALGIIPFLSEPEYEEDDRSDMDDKIIDACQEHNLESEPYGVHDISCGQTENIDGKEYEAIFGFNTYEVPEERIEELITIWKDIFEDELGFETGDIIITER